MSRRLFVLLFCLFVVMIGFGVTLPVLPFYARHLDRTVGVSRETMALHITLLSSIYAFMQLIFAPFWGQQADRIGRRPLMLLGIAGSMIAQILFGFATSLWALYIVRAIGGLLSSATLPTATAYVTDVTTDRDRNRGMAWLGSAVSLGIITGPALGGLTTREDLHFTLGFIDIKIENYALPFFLSAVFMFFALLAAVKWLPESLPSTVSSVSSRNVEMKWKNLDSKLKLLLALTLISQFGLAIFEGTFALYAQEKLGYGPTQTGFAFMVCGAVMAVFQAIAVNLLSQRINIIAQLALGFGLMGLGIVLLLLVRILPFVLGAVGLLALGMALVAPNLSALISKRGGQHVGAVLGIQNAASSLGQVGGPMLGGMLFAWQASAPFAIAGVFLMSIGLVMAWKERMRHH